MGDLNRLSHFLAKLLRHEAKSRGLDVTPEGYVAIEDILTLPEAQRHSESDVEGIVRRDNKGRFEIRIRNGKREIKATQGHSFKLDSPELTPIRRHTDVRVVLHGTRIAHWPSIKSQGLSRRGRTHIHFAEGVRVQSGFPPNCDMAIEIDIEKAMAGGYEFYKSENGVILCEGNHDGVIPSQYFRRAYDLRTNEEIL